MDEFVKGLRCPSNFSKTILSFSFLLNGYWTEILIGFRSLTIPTEISLHLTEEPFISNIAVDMAEDTAGDSRERISEDMVRKAPAVCKSLFGKAAGKGNMVRTVDKEDLVSGS